MTRARATRSPGPFAVPAILASFRRSRAAALLLVATLALLPACGSAPPGIDHGPFFAGREAYGAEPPEGALMLTNERFVSVAQQEGFVWDSTARQERLREEAEAQFEADAAEILRLVAEQPQLAWLLEEPDTSDPDIEVLPSGEYLVTLLDSEGNPFQVRTLGQADRYHDYLVARERYHDVGNQLTVYGYAFDALPSELQSNLPSPAQLAGSSLEAVLDARDALEALLAENDEVLGAVAEQLYLAEHGGAARRESALSLSSVDEYRPPGYPASPADELGAGVGSDRGTSSSFSAFGLQANFWWPLKYYTTSVKLQANRGSCVAFALTSALETSVAVRTNQWVNLSEQHLYHRIKGSWQPAHYGDGAKTHKMAQAFADSDYVLPYEEQWNYNPSWSRMDLGWTYGLSCLNYGEHCSNTTHQGRYACTSYGSATFCGYYAPPNVNGVGYQMPDVHVLWQRGPFSLVPYLTIWLYLLQGHSVVAALDVDTSFADPSLGYVSSSAGEKSGGHAVHIVGFIADSFIVASDLPSFVKDGAAASGGGYFIIKNSWGEGSGDRGYLYVPVAWAHQRFKSVSIFDRGTAPNFLETAPNIEIVAPQQGAVVSYGGFNTVSFEATVSDLQDGTSCCPVQWTSDQDGIIGNGTTIDHVFPSPGPRTVTATATDSKGNASSASVTLVVTNSPPTVSITSPGEGETLYLGVPAVFHAQASDINEFAGIDCASFTWTSNMSADPTLAGCSPTATFTDLGPRQLTVTATDAFGETGDATVNVVVAEAPDHWVVVTEPKDGDAFWPGDAVLLRASVSHSFAVGTPYEWRAYSSSTAFEVIASGTVQSTRGNQRFIPSHTWQSGPEHEGLSYGLRVAVDGDVLSQQVSISFVPIPK